jgi:hypothetical protein
MKNENNKIGVIIYTYNRIDDAKINMEIIRRVWARRKFLSDVKIIHAFNGSAEWWPGKFLEDELLYLDNPGHFSGAAKLIDEGINSMRKLYPFIEYVIIVSADTWLVKPTYIEKVINGMAKNKKYLASCGWSYPLSNGALLRDIATDFFVVNVKWALSSGFFPLRYQEFVDRYNEILHFLGTSVIYLEQLVLTRFKLALLKTYQVSSEFYTNEMIYESIYHMIDREPTIQAKKNPVSEKIVYERKYYWRNIGIICNHDPYQKQISLAEWDIPLEEHGRRFMGSKDLSYFNLGKNNTTYSKQSK